MKYTDIPGLGKKSSKAVFGAGNVDFARRQECIEMMDAFVQNGGNIFDTANIYGRWLESGLNESEIIIGDWLYERIELWKAFKREDIIISTKGGHPDLNTMEIHRMNYEDIKADLDESLNSLKLDYIDIYWLHRDALSLPVKYIIDSLMKLRKSGKIKLFGLSNWNPQRLSEALDYLKSIGEEDGFFGVQNRWSLASMNKDGSEDKTLEAMSYEQYNLHHESQFFEMPYSSMGKGYFSKLLNSGKENLPAGLLQYYDNELNDLRFNALSKLSEKLNENISRLTLAYLINQPFPVIPIFGSSNPGQLQDIVSATEIKLSDDDMKLLSQGVPY